MTHKRGDVAILLHELINPFIHANEEVDPNHR